MAKYNEKFNRVEKKYLLNQSQFENLIKHIHEYIEKDDYFKYTVYNIYYDSEDSKMIQTSLQKPIYKEKLRLRSYVEVDDNSDVFVEMKKKFQNTVFKRRINLKLHDAINYLDLKKSIDNDSQIKKEIDYMIKIYNPVKKLYLAYDRIAFHGIMDNEVRITFYKNIRYRFKNINLMDSDEDLYLLNDNQCLMEVKVQDTLPLWLTSALNKVKIYPTSFSKYGNIYSESLKHKNIKEFN